MADKISPIKLQIYKNRFSSIAEEMGVTLNRTAFSPNIKERRDFSCAIFNADGEMVAQAAHIPVHLGSMPLSVQSAIRSIDMEAGDMVMLNDPYRGGTHLPDITLVAPVFVDEDCKPAFYVANRAHHSDVGGMTAGSMPVSTSLFQEGIIIPPVKIVKKGVVCDDVKTFFLANVRTPEEREGDLNAQIMANIVGGRRISAMINSFGETEVCAYANALLDYAARMTAGMIDVIPDGNYRFEDVLDDDGMGTEQIKIVVNININKDKAVIDFSESADQVMGSVNAVYAITLSCVLFVLRALNTDDIPANSGVLKPVEVVTRKGSVVDAEFPAAVAAGNVETSQRIVDVLLGAFGKAVPERVPAASQGTMNNMIIGGVDSRTGKPFTYYETLAGGAGASKYSDGESAVHTNMTNTMNTPVEALEYSYPFLVKEYSIRDNSGGNGIHKGGDGLVREIELLDDAEVTLITERRVSGPFGLNDGFSGKCGKNIVNSNNSLQLIAGKLNKRFKRYDIIRIETPGGGGWGKK